MHILAVIIIIIIIITILDDRMASHLFHGKVVKAVAWDVTVASTLADYVGASSTFSAAAAEQAAYRKSMKYADLPGSTCFFPVSSHSGGDARAHQ